MQDPNADTEWNDQLRRHGILPAKKKEAEISEDDVVKMIEETIAKKTGAQEKSKEDMTLDELAELEDEEDERAFQEYRARRIAELKLTAERNKFGDVRDISASDYKEQVNGAGDGVWVVLHLYKPGIPLCSLVNNHLSLLAAKFRSTKFLRSVSDTCIPNYPDANLPTIFVYFEGNMTDKLIGPAAFRGMNLSVEELEWLLSKTGAVKTELQEDPRPKVDDVLFAQLGRRDADEDSDEN